MKCMPITRSGRPVAAASIVIEIDDVLLANSALGEHCASSVRNSFEFCVQFFGGGFDRQVDVERIDRLRWDDPGRGSGYVDPR